MSVGVVTRSVVWKIRLKRQRRTRYIISEHFLASVSQKNECNEKHDKIAVFSVYSHAIFHAETKNSDISVFRVVLH